MTKIQFSNIQEEGQEGNGMLFSKSNRSVIAPHEEAEVKQKIKSHMVSMPLKSQVTFKAMKKKNVVDREPSIDDMAILTTASSPFVRKQKDKQKAKGQNGGFIFGRRNRIQPEGAPPANNQIVPANNQIAPAPAPPAPPIVPALVPAPARARERRLPVEEDIMRFNAREAGDAVQARVNRVRARRQQRIRDEALFGVEPQPVWRDLRDMLDAQHRADQAERLRRLRLREIERDRAIADMYNDPDEFFIEIQDDDEDEAERRRRRQRADGFFTRDEGRLPPSVRKLLEQVKDEKITSVQAWRYPLMKPLQDILKKFVTLPYDSVFHLGLNLSGKYNLEKDVVIKFTKGGQKSDTQANKSKIVPVTKDITYGQLFDGLQKKMGKNYTSYNARKNNCQDFSLAILSVLGIDDAELKTFIKQDAEKIYKSFGAWEKIAETAANLSSLKDQVVDRLTQGEGHQEIHNFYYPKCNVQF